MKVVHKRVYVATARGPCRSDDEGQHWELINEGLQRPYTLHIAAAPDDADVVLVAVSRNAGRQEPQFYRSTTGGQTWQLVEGLGSDDDMGAPCGWACGMGATAQDVAGFSWPCSLSPG